MRGMQSYAESMRGKEGGMKHREKRTNKEMEDERELTNEKLNRLTWDSQLKKVRRKESLDLLAMIRARLLNVEYLDVEVFPVPSWDESEVFITKSRLGHPSFLCYCDGA
jgi:hypothetical protein